MGLPIDPGSGRSLPYRLVTANRPGFASAADKAKLDGIEALADVTSTNETSHADVIVDGDFNAQTILRATTDDTPTALTVGEQTLVGRITAGNIEALSTTQIRTLINVEDGADVTSTNETTHTGVARIETGQYTGDGTSSQIISLTASWTPKYVNVWMYNPGNDAYCYPHFRSDQEVSDSSFFNMTQQKDNRIIAIGAGSFTVDYDDGAGSSPNVSGTTYNYLALG